MRSDEGPDFVLDDKYYYTIMAKFAFVLIFEVNQSWKPSTISVRLDFLKCVQIFLSSKTQICTENVSRFSWQQCKSVQ